LLPLLPLLLPLLLQQQQRRQQQQEDTGHGASGAFAGLARQKQPTSRCRPTWVPVAKHGQPSRVVARCTRRGGRRWRIEKTAGR
jgi:hypothetical protein